MLRGRGQAAPIIARGNLSHAGRMRSSGRQSRPPRQALVAFPVAVPSCLTTTTHPRPEFRLQSPTSEGPRAEGRAATPRGAPPEVALRLAIGRDGIGLELASPVRLGCARITHLTAFFAGLHFPVDVSGGVARFRHRWSELQRLELEVSVRALGALGGAQATRAGRSADSGRLGGRRALAGGRVRLGAKGRGRSHTGRAPPSSPSIFTCLLRGRTSSSSWRTPAERTSRPRQRPSRSGALRPL